MSAPSRISLALYEPEIPPNTGNIARLCAATKTSLHLIEPLGFSLDDKYLKRAGLDYWPHVPLAVWPSWPAFTAAGEVERYVLSSARSGVLYHEFEYRPGDCLVLGPETRGLPAEMMAQHAEHVRIPIWGEVRSLNLSTAAGIMLYEAMRQVGDLVGR